MASYSQSKSSKLWSVRFYINVDGREKQKRLSGFARKKDAEQAYLAYLAQETPEKLAESGLMFDGLVEAYLAHIRLNTKESTVYSLDSKIRSRILPYFARRKVAAIKAIDVESWTATLTDCSYQYKLALRGQLSAILRYADRYYDIPTVMTKVAPIRNTEPKKEMLFWSEEEFARFVSSIPEKNNAHRLFFMTLYLVGARKGEALALTWSDIDLDNGLISITKNITRKTSSSAWAVTTPKNQASNRTVSIPSSLCAEFARYRSTLVPSPQSSDFVFGGDRPLADRTTDRVFLNACEISGVKKIRLHDLRHSCASFLISHGVSIVAVSKRLGHSNVEQTLNTYSHMMPRDDEMMLKIVDKIVSQVVSKSI